MKHRVQTADDENPGRYSFWIDYSLSIGHYLDWLFFLGWLLVKLAFLFRLTFRVNYYMDWLFFLYLLFSLDWLLFELTIIWADFLYGLTILFSLTIICIAYFFSVDYSFFVDYNPDWLCFRGWLLTELNILFWLTMFGLTIFSGFAIIWIDYSFWVGSSSWVD